MNLFFKLFIANLFKFKGRSSRQEYIVRFLITLMLCIIITYTSAYTKHSNSWSIFIFDSLVLIVFLIYIIQMFPLTHRRLHDLNASGWWQLITFIPCGQILMIGFIFFKGTQGPNKYGKEPKY